MSAMAAPPDPSAAGREGWTGGRAAKLALGGGTILAALVLWDLAVRLFGIAEFIMPSPAAALAALLAEWRLILDYTWVTSVEILLGFLVGGLGGALLGILVHRFPTVEKALNPLIIFFQIIPKIALAPIFLLWFGFGLAPKVILVAVVAFFPVTLNAIAGLAATNPDLGFLVQSVGGTRNQYLLNVEIPSAMPQIFAGLKIAMTFSVIGAVVGEFTGGSEGLGYLILFSSSQVRTPLLFASLLAIAALGLVMYYAIVLLEYLALPWHRQGTARRGNEPQWQN